MIFKIFKNEKLVFFITLIFFASFIGFYIYFRENNCYFLIKKEIKKLGPEYKNLESIIYLIKDANTLCRPLIKYDELKYDFPRIIFFVDKSYSENDIENFIDSFKIFPYHHVNKMTVNWQKVLEKCNRNKYISNIFIQINKEGNILELIKF